MKEHGAERMDSLLQRREREDAETSAHPFIPLPNKIYTFTSISSPRAYHVKCAGPKAKKRPPSSSSDGQDVPYWSCYECTMVCVYVYVCMRVCVCGWTSRSGACLSVFVDVHLCVWVESGTRTSL